MSDATTPIRATPRRSTKPAAAAAESAAAAEDQADMVTTADLVTLQQQLRQEVADVIQQLIAEVNEAISGRMDMMNSINAALPRVTAKSAESKPYRISVKRGGKGQEKGGKGENRTCWTCGKTGHIAAWCGKGGKKNLYAMDEDDSEDTKEYSNRSNESEEDL